MQPAWITAAENTADIFREVGGMQSASMKSNDVGNLLQPLMLTLRPNASIFGQSDAGVRGGVYQHQSLCKAQCHLGMPESALPALTLMHSWT